VTDRLCFTQRWHSYNVYLSIYLSTYLSIPPIKDNLNAIRHAVGHDSETKSTEHCPKYKVQ